MKLKASPLYGEYSEAGFEIYQGGTLLASGPAPPLLSERAREQLKLAAERVGQRLAKDLGAKWLGCGWREIKDY